jgi:hypothetical protein
MKNSFKLIALAVALSTAVACSSNKAEETTDAVDSAAAVAATDAAAASLDSSAVAAVDTAIVAAVDSAVAAQ